MPIIQMPGSPLGHAGIAAAGAMQGEAQFRNQLASVHLRNKDLAQREAIATERLQARGRMDLERQAGALQRGLQQSMNLAGELGVDTTLGGFQALDQELMAANPGLHRQIAEAYGVPASDTSADFPLAYNARAKAVEQIRTQQGAQAKSQLVAEFSDEAESAGYTDEMALEVQALEMDPNTTPGELRLKIEEFRGEAQAAETQRQAKEYGKAEALKVAQANPSVLSQPGMSTVFGALSTGTSKNPKKDLMMLRIASNGESDVMEELQAEAFMLGQEQSRRQFQDEFASQQIDPSLRGGAAAAPDDGAAATVARQQAGIASQAAPQAPPKLEEFPNLARMLAPSDDELENRVLKRIQDEKISLDDAEAIEAVTLEEMERQRKEGGFRPVGGDITVREKRKGPSPWDS